MYLCLYHQDQELDSLLLGVANLLGARVHLFTRATKDDYAFSGAKPQCCADALVVTLPPPGIGLLS